MAKSALPVLVALASVLGHGTSTAAPLPVPAGSPAVRDGSCAEYGDGVAETFPDAGGATATVHLKHDGTWLWVCFEGARGADANRAATLWLDPVRSPAGPPDADDLALATRVEDGTRSSWRGSGGPDGGFVPRPGIDPLWAAAAAVGRSQETVEYGVPLVALQAGACGRELGLALGHLGVAFPGDDHVWPAGASPGDLGSWRSIEVQDVPCACGGTFDVVADAEIRESDPDFPLGGEPRFAVAREGSERRSLLAFDVVASLPPDATVASALLQLPLVDGASAGPYAVEARRVDEAWSEPTVTWASAPATGAVHGTRETDLASGTLTVDVTPLVRRWAAREVAEQSVALATPTAGAVLEFGAREDVGGAGVARLAIRCAPASPEIATDSVAGDDAQIAALERVAADSDGPPEVVLEDRGGGVRHATFSIPVPAPVAPDGAARARWFLSEYRDLFRTADPATGWQLVRRSKDDRHLFFRQRRGGVPVFPSMLVVHVEDGRIAGAAGRYVPGLAVDPSPRLPAVQAEAAARAGGTAVPDGRTSLVVYAPELLDAGGPPRLAWAVPFPLETVLVDASTGAVLDRIAEAREASFHIYDAAGDGPELGVTPCSKFQPYFSPYDLWFDEGGAVGGGQDAEGWNAFAAMKDVDQYWDATLGQWSYDGWGTRAWLYVHVGTQTSWTSAGYGWPNAVAMPKCDVFEFSDTTPHHDVVGHEYTHAVTRWSAGLVYKNQSGALNEHYSDVFGQRVDPTDWTIGEDVPGVGPWRDMAAPRTFNDPDRMAGYFSTSTDNGGVHTNSGIPNKAFHLATEGGVHYGYPVTGIGAKKTEKLWYYVLQYHLGESSKFIDARNAFVSVATKFAAKKTYAFSASDACQVRNAWAAVGLGDGDLDCDGIPDSTDADGDGDWIADSKDNCPLIQNPSQKDSDKDGAGDACDNDDDGDGVADAVDNCPLAWNPGQADHHPPPAGDACDDFDGDGVVDATDNCDDVPNPDQNNADGDSSGDACDLDDDNDGIADANDNCSLVKNPNQQDGDGDGIGDACDLCPTVSSPDNTDTDGDGKGNPCDADDDNDGVLDEFDNCPLVANSGQADTDGNGVGMACDEAERDAFTEMMFGGGLIVPVHHDPDFGPATLPIPVGPADGPEDLPGGTKIVIDLSYPIAYVAHVLASDGSSWAKAGPVTGATTFSFAPPAWGATTYGSTTPAVAAADAGSAAGAPEAASLLVPAPDQTRFSLVIVAAEPVPPGATHDLEVRYGRRYPPNPCSYVPTDACAGTGGEPSDGVVAPGETATLAVSLGLEEDVPASGVAATLVATTPGVTVTRARADFPDLGGAGGTRSLEPHFAFAVDRSVACGESLQFVLTVETDATRFSYPVSLTAGGTAFAESADTPLAIPDLGTAISTLDIAAVGTVNDADVTVRVAHGDVGELELTLVAPSGERLPLFVRTGAGPDFDGTTFDDGGARSILEGRAPYAARYRPEIPLANLAGVAASGAWQLEVADAGRGFAGTLLGWSLRLDLADAACEPCEATVPGEVGSVRWTGKTGLAWDAVPGAGWYDVHVGEAADLPRLLDGAADSCRTWYGTATATTLDETPTGGAFLWYLVRAANAAGDGPPGSATTGPRSHDSAGDCP